MDVCEFVIFAVTDVHPAVEWFSGLSASLQCCMSIEAAVQGTGRAGQGRAGQGRVRAGQAGQGRGSTALG